MNKFIRFLIEVLQYNYENMIWKLNKYFICSIINHNLGNNIYRENGVTSFICQRCLNKIGQVAT